ncbi:RNA 2',3'-cyclic phosphodiesterase [Escherichia coli]
MLSTYLQNAQTGSPLARHTLPPEAGRPVAADNLHLTVDFRRSERREREGAFSFSRTDSSTWFHSRLMTPDNGCVRVWCGCGCRQPPRGLIQLANMLRSQAARSGCFQSNRPFHPHITLLRDASEAVTIPPPGFNWSYAVTEFTLYASSFARGRTRYTPLKRWALTQ